MPVTANLLGSACFHGSLVRVPSNPNKMWPVRSVSGEDRDVSCHPASSWGTLICKHYFPLAPILLLLGLEITSSLDFAVTKCCLVGTESVIDWDFIQANLQYIYKCENQTSLLVGKSNLFCFLAWKAIYHLNARIAARIFLIKILIFDTRVRWILQWQIFIL